MSGGKAASVCLTGCLPVSQRCRRDWLWFSFFKHYYSRLKYERNLYSPSHRKVLQMPVEIRELLIKDLIVNYSSTEKYARPSQSTQTHCPALGSYWLLPDSMEQICNEVVKGWGREKLVNLLRHTKHYCPARNGRDGKLAPGMRKKLCLFISQAT